MLHAGIITHGLPETHVACQVQHALVTLLNHDRPELVTGPLERRGTMINKLFLQGFICSPLQLRGSERPLLIDIMPTWYPST